MKPQVLIADDEEGVRESLNLILSDFYDVTLATDGQEALTCLQERPFAVAFLDIKMPKLDGMDVLKQVKSRGVSTPILMLTAYQSVELAKEAVKLGAYDYLPKPFDRDHILGAVRNVLAGTPLPEEWREVW